MILFVCSCWFLINFIFCRLAETAISGSHQSRDLRSDVSLGSQCSCHLRLFIECVCVWSTKSSNHAGLLCCSKLKQLTSNPKHNYARVPMESTRCESEMGQICTIQTSCF